VSATTRAPRPGEVDGVDYQFLSDEEFEALRRAGGLLEAFEVFGHSYGTPRAPVEEHLAAGEDVLLEIDVQGALEVRKDFPGNALLVFVKPPSREEQRRRLVARGEDDTAEIERRLAAAETEEAQAEQFDVVVVNDDVGSAVDEVAGSLESRRSAQ
jgi:guanylate kinase